MNKILNASKIDLSNTGLTEIPAFIYQCKNLKKLNLSHNNISGLTKEINSLKFLKNLDISYNQISILYSKVFDLKDLEVLILNNNNLSKIPEQIGQLTKLRKLSIANNHIEELPDIISSLTKLESFDLTNNKFKDFPSQLLSIKTLKCLWLGKNVFNNFPTKSIKRQLTSLRYLYCFSSLGHSINSFENDYKILQQVKGNCIDSLQLLEESDILDDKMMQNIEIKNTEKQSIDKTVVINNHKPKDPHIFISYSHKDNEYKEEIEISLNGIKHLGYKFEFWSDTDIKGGDIWREEIDKAIARASIAINVVSRYYLASNFINEIEIPALLIKAKNEGTLILNVIARKCNFQNSVLEPFQTINDPNKPIQSETPAEQQKIYTWLETRILKHFTDNIQSV